MDPIDLFLKNRKATSVGTPAGGGTYGGPAYGGSVAPVVPGAPQFTAAPTIALGGSMPDYGALMAADPSYQAYLNSSQKDVAQAAAMRNEALDKLAIQFGGLPPGMKDVYGDIDAGTLELAQKNQYSDVKRIDKQYTEGVEAFKRALAARGALQSGETGYGLAQADYARGEAEYDLGNQFANAAQGIVNQFVGVESGARAGLAGALSQAQQNVYSNPANRPTDAYDAPLVEGWEQYGQPVYRAPDGSLVDIKGNPFNPPVGGSAAPGGGGGTFMLDPATGQIVQAPPGYMFPTGTFGYA